MSQRNGLGQYKRVLQIFRNIGYISAANVRMHVYYGLYMLVSNPNLFGNLPELMETDRLHGGVFTINPICTKFYNARVLAFE